MATLGPSDSDDLSITGTADDFHGHVSTDAAGPHFTIVQAPSRSARNLFSHNYTRYIHSLSASSLRLLPTRFIVRIKPVELNRFEVGIMTTARPRVWGLVAAHRFSQTAPLAQLFNLLLKQTPRPRGSVQRDCIRRGGNRPGVGYRAHRPSGYNYLHLMHGSVRAPGRTRLDNIRASW
jgi:hypothetical protein